MLASKMFDTPTNFSFKGGTRGELRGGAIGAKPPPWTTEIWKEKIPEYALAWYISWNTTFFLDFSVETCMWNVSCLLRKKNPRNCVNVLGGKVELTPWKNCVKLKHNCVNALNWIGSPESRCKKCEVVLIYIYIIWV